MNKKKKLISLLTATPLVIASTALAISCGKENSDDGGDISIDIDPSTEKGRIQAASLGANPDASSKRFDQSNKSTVKLAVTFSRGGYQWNGLKDIIDAYNATQKGTKGFLPVSLENVGSGYGGGADAVSAALSAKNKDNFFNLILNYGNVAAQLAEFDMLLSFNSNIENQNTDITNFSSAFTENNNNIQNVINKSTYLLPFSKSTNISYYDGIVMFYIIDAFNKNKALDMNDPDTKKWYDELKEIQGNNNGTAVTGENQNDLGYVQSLWGDVVSDAKTKLDSYIKKPLKKSDLLNYVSLLKFAKTAQQLFENSAKPDSTLHVLGFDDPTSALELAVFQQNNGDYSESLEAPSIGGDGNTNINFNGINNNGSKIQIAARTAFNEFYDAYRSNALVLQEQGAYTSTDLVYHKYAFAIGSTAGYSHDYIDDSKSLFIYNAPKTLGTFSFSASFDDGTKLKQPDYVYFNYSPAAADKTDVVGLFGSYKNPIYKFASYEFEGSKYKNLNKKPESSYGLITNSNDDTNTLTSAATANAEALKAGTAALIILPQKSSNPEQLNEMITDIKNYAETDTNNFVYAGTLAKASDPSKKYVAFIIKGLESPVVYTDKKDNTTEMFPNGLSVKTALTNFWNSISGSIVETKDYNSLGQKELKIMYAPTTWNGTGDTKYGYLQGPSIIGIHSNTEGDSATRLFVNWFVTHGKKIKNPDYVPGQKDTKNKPNPEFLLDGKSPIQYMEIKMSYISPVTGFENKESENYLDPETFNKGKYANPMLTLSAQMFEEAANKSTTTKWKLYESPAGVKSSSFRDAVAAAFKSMQKTDYSFNNFANSIQSSLSGSK